MPNLAGDPSEERRCVLGSTSPARPGGDAREARRASAGEAGRASLGSGRPSEEAPREPMRSSCAR